MRGGLTAGALVLALLLAAGTAQAQTSAALLSNTGQSSAGGVGFSYDYAQKFHTGSKAFTLTHVDLEMRSTASPPPTYTVTIREGPSSNRPNDTSLATLTPPTSLPASFGPVRFTAPSGLTLTGNRWHFIVVDVSAGDDNTEWQTTGSRAKDAGNVRSPRTRFDFDGSGTILWRNQDNTGGWVIGERVAKVAIYGSVRDTTSPTLLGGTLRGNTVKLYFSEDLDTSATLDATKFIVTSTPDLGAVSSPTINSSEPNIVTLTLANTATTSQTATLGVGTSSGLRDPAGNALAALSSFALTNIGPSDPAAPTLSTAEFLGDTLMLTYN